MACIELAQPRVITIEQKTKRYSLTVARIEKNSGLATSEESDPPRKTKGAKASIPLTRPLHLLSSWRKC